MLIKLLLKIWPALTPLLLYLLWVLIVIPIIGKFSKKSFIEAEYEEVSGIKTSKEKIGHFSFKNRYFVTVIYLSLVLMIISFLFFAIRTPKIEDGTYIPARSENGKIIPGKIIETLPAKNRKF